MRQLPNGLIHRALAAWGRDDAGPLVCYFHVWELDPDQPRISAVSALERLRQYRNLQVMSKRIRYYLDRYRFGTISEYLGLPPASPRISISVVVPCYNEEATLGYTANTLRAFADSVKDDFAISYVFVDDGSRDGTWRRLNELFACRPDCVLVRHPLNRGVAAATLTGICNSRTEVVCAIDCDATYDPRQLRYMVPMPRRTSIS